MEKAALRQKTSKQVQAPFSLSSVELYRSISPNSEAAAINSKIISDKRAELKRALQERKGLKQYYSHFLIGFQRFKLFVRSCDKN